MFDNEFHATRIETNKDRLTRLINTFKEKCYHQSIKKDVKKKIAETTDEILSFERKKDALFTHSNTTEKMLKIYSENINGKMYKDEDVYDSYIGNLARDNLKLIEDFQEKVKYELYQSKNQIELEVIEKFNQNEKEQHQKMNERISQQKNVFDRMEETKKGLSKIKDDFVELNKKFDTQWKLSTSLKVELKLKMVEVNGCTKILKEQKDRHQFLLKAFNNTFETLLNTATVNDDEVLDMVNKINPLTKTTTDREYIAPLAINKMNDVSLSQSPSAANLLPTKARLSKNSFTSLDFTQMINAINDENDRMRLQYSDKYNVLSAMIYQRNEMGQLIQKCIEDISFEYNRIKKGKNSELALREITLKRLESELDKVTFIYDNCINAKKGISLNKTFPLKIKERKQMPSSQRTLMKVSKYKYIPFKKNDAIKVSGK